MRLQEEIVWGECGIPDMLSLGNIVGLVYGRSHLRGEQTREGEMDKIRGKKLRFSTLLNFFVRLPAYQNVASQNVNM